MIKLLQKYKMYILVVAGILIMVGFLLGDFIRQLSQYSMENERVYTLDGKKVSKADLQNAAIHYDGIKRVLGNDAAKRQFGIDDDAAQWQLATTAAERAGVIGGPADGRAFAQAFATQTLAREFGTQQFGFADWKKNLQTRQNLTDEQADAKISQIVDTLLANAGRTGNAAVEGATALAEYRGLQRLVQSYGDVPQTSENRLAFEARRLLDVAVVKYIYVPLTEARIAAAPAPTAEEMQAQFEKYKDTEVDAGGGGMGYRQKDRVTYTWFSIDRAAVSKAVKVDPIEVSKRALSKSPDGKVDTTVRRQLEDEIRGELTQRALDDFTGGLRAEFLRTSALLPDKDGYKVLPADWKKPDLNAVVKTVVERIATEKKTTIPLPSVNAVTTPQDARAFLMEKGIGTTMIARTGQQPIILRDVLFSAKELGKPAGKVPAQVGVPIPSAFTGYDGNLYFVMLDSVAPAASPKTLDEVRPQVEKDLRKVKALAQFKTELEANLMPVITLGMNAAPNQLAAIGYPGLTVQSGLAQRFSAEQGQGVANEQGVPAQREVQDQAFVEAAVSRAEKLDPARQVQPDTAPDRTFVHALTSGEGAIIAQVTGLKPVTAETFRMVVSEPRFLAMIEQKEIGPRDVAPFRTGTLIKRFNVTGLDPSKKSDEEP